MSPGAASPSVQSQPGLLTVTDPRLFSAGHEEAALLFARRLMRFPEVQSLEIDPVLSRATLCYRVPPDDPQAVVLRLASALTEEQALPPGSLPVWDASEPVTLYRHGDIITTLKIAAPGNDRIEASHPFLGHKPAVARGIEAVLCKQPGILHAAVADALVRVRFDPAVISIANVVRLIESELPARDPHSVQKADEVQFAQANTSVGVNALALAVPALMPVGAGLVVLNGVRCEASPAMM